MLLGLAVTGQGLVRQYSLPSQASVFTAELLAIKTALDTIANTSSDTSFVIYTDSLSALQALQSFNPGHSLVALVRLSLHSLTSLGYRVQLCWIPAHVGIDGNEMADQAAKAAVNLPLLQNDLPISDWLPLLRPSITSTWQSEWSCQPPSVKLRSIKPNVHPWSSSFHKVRRYEVILTRLRIGHTRLTHGFLMSTPRQSFPLCPTCNVRLTILHIFTLCPDFARLRFRYFGNKTLSQILSEGPAFSINKIMSFLKSSDLYDSV